MLELFGQQVSMSVVYYMDSLLFLSRYWLDLTPTDIHWSHSDTGWAKAAWSNLFAPWLHGACVFIHNSQKFDAEEMVQVPSNTCSHTVKHKDGASV